MRWRGGKTCVEAGEVEVLALVCECDCGRVAKSENELVDDDVVGVIVFVLVLDADVDRSYEGPYG